MFVAKPALHRYPAAMARRAHELCLFLVEQLRRRRRRGVARTSATATSSTAALRALPGYGDEKAKIFMAILAKRLGKRPTGWEAAAAPFSDATPARWPTSTRPSRWPRSASSRR